MNLNHLVFATLLIATIGTTLSSRECPPCGTTRAPYPLSTTTTCGDQNYKIECSNGVLKFPTSNLPNTCVTRDIATTGVQLNPKAPFNITGDNTIMFLNCTPLLFQSPLNCSTNSLCHVYINATRDGFACKNAPICCSFRAGGGTTAYSIRVREEGCRGYTSFVDLNPGLHVGKWGRAGLMLQWMLPLEPVCRTQVDCGVDLGNSTCKGDRNSEGISRCFCNSGLRWDGIQGFCVG